MSDKRAQVLVRGLVQGVSYRAWAADQARQLELCGWVRNQADGSVEALVQGAEGQVNQFVERCRSGPAEARVTSVDQTPERTGTELKGFQITRGG